MVLVLPPLTDFSVVVLLHPLVWSWCPILQKWLSIIVFICLMWILELLMKIIWFHIAITWNITLQCCGHKFGSVVFMMSSKNLNYFLFQICTSVLYDFIEENVIHNEAWLLVLYISDILNWWKQIIQQLHIFSDCLMSVSGCYQLTNAALTTNK